MLWIEDSVVKQNSQNPDQYKVNIDFSKAKEKDLPLLRISSDVKLSNRKIKRNLNKIKKTI